MGNRNYINILVLETGKNRIDLMLHKVIITCFAAVSLASCCSKTASAHSAKSSPPVSSLMPKSNEAKERKAIEIAIEFIKIAYGHSIADEYLSSEFPPIASYFSRSDKWNVRFTNGISTSNVMLDGQLLRGTISRMDGKIYKRTSNDEATGENLPLFTLDEFNEIIKLPHNNFDW